MIYGNIIQDGHANNSMFASEDSTHLYNPTHTARRLKEEFYKHGIDINTSDINANKKVDFELHIEGRALENNGITKYLLASENPYINKLNANTDYLANFETVFTWNKSFFNLPNVTPIFVPNEIKWEASPCFEDRAVFSCLINANKAFPEPLENDLYQERLSTIRWYEANAPELFQLYGMGWHKPPRAFTNIDKIKRRIMRLRSQLFSFQPFPSYRGEIKNKSDILHTSKFSFCYENVKNLPNYITEKIFDSLLAGCVPIYWGADNVTEHIPSHCFIDRRDFKNTAELNDYLCSITEHQYQAYQENIKEFLLSKHAYLFSSISFSEIIATKIHHDLVSPMNKK